MYLREQAERMGDGWNCSR